MVYNPTLGPTVVYNPTLGPATVRNTHLRTSNGEVYPEVHHPEVYPTLRFTTLRYTQLRGTLRYTQLRGTLRYTQVCTTLMPSLTTRFTVGQAPQAQTCQKMINFIDIIDHFVINFRYFSVSGRKGRLGGPVPRVGGRVKVSNPRYSR